MLSTLGFHESNSLYTGRYCSIVRYPEQQDAVVKIPLSKDEQGSMGLHYIVAKTIATHLPEHQNVVYYLGLSKQPQGLIFRECKLGNLQHYLNAKPTIPLPERLHLTLDAARGLAHCHSNGVLVLPRMENLLLDRISQSDGVLYKSKPQRLTLRFGGFGGSCLVSEGRTILSVRQRLNAQHGSDEMLGEGKPSAGFRDPGHNVETELADIFAIGSAFYYIMTNKQPHDDGSMSEEAYELRFDALVGQREFPSTNKIPYIGDIISRCWDYRYPTANDLYSALLKAATQNMTVFKDQLQDWNPHTHENPID